MTDTNHDHTTDTEPRRSLRTHAGALIGNHLGQPVPSCKGALELLNVDDDKIVRNGELVSRTIYVYQCVECGSRISIARELWTQEEPEGPLAFGLESLAWELLNAYRPQTLPPADRLAAELAHAFELPARGSTRNGQE